MCTDGEVSQLDRILNLENGNAYLLFLYTFECINVMLQFNAEVTCAKLFSK